MRLPFDKNASHESEYTLAASRTPKGKLLGMFCESASAPLERKMDVTPSFEPSGMA
jgi:hypothetical protein